MARDIKDLFEKEQSVGLSENHVHKFEQRLDEAFPKQKRNNWYLKIAASVAIILTSGVLLFSVLKSDNPVETIVNEDHKEQTTNKEVPAALSLGDISPELKKLEQYYVTNINLELSQLPDSKENEALLNSFLDKLSELDQEYKRLTQELNEVGPNENTVNALIENLQFKLQLLYQLKNKLNEIKESKNEQFINQNA